MQNEQSAELLASVRILDAPVRDMLAEDLPRQLAAIHTALGVADLATARLEVHAVRGSAAFCKLARLRDAAAALENSLINNEKNAEHIRAFENNIKSVLHALEHAKENTG
ncbi:MAG TPA: Hpt domain-containing protein [Gammaproteobacteria bacterium]